MDMGAGGFAQKKKGVGILLKNKKRKRKIIQTKFVCDQRKLELTSVYFPHSGYAGMHIEKVYKNIESNCNKNTSKSSRETSMLNLDLETTLENTHRENPITRDLHEAVVDDPELCGTQHNMQKNRKTIHIQILK